MEHARPSSLPHASEFVRTEALAPGIWEALVGPNGNTYHTLIKRLWPNIATLTTRAGAVNSQPIYQSLLMLANSIATSAGGRLLITVPDGTVLVDTSRDDGIADARFNSYQNFLTKTIKENHNSRISILSAQLYPCGLGVETKRSTTTGRDEHYVAVRLGGNLNNEGTARLSIVVP